MNPPLKNNANVILDYDIPSYKAKIIPIASFIVPAQMSTYIPNSRQKYKTTAQVHTQSTLHPSLIPLIPHATIGHDTILFDELYPTSDKPVYQGVSGLHISSPIDVLWDAELSSIPTQSICVLFAYGVVLYDIGHINISINKLKDQLLDAKAKSPTPSTSSSSIIGSPGKSSVKRPSSEPNIEDIENALQTFPLSILDPLSIHLFNTETCLNPNTATWNIFASDYFSQIISAHGSSILFWDLQTTSKLYASSVATSNSSSQTPTYVLNPIQCISTGHTYVTHLSPNYNKSGHFSTAGVDGIVKIWNYKRTSQGLRPVALIQAHTEPVQRCLFNTIHDQLIITAGNDSKTRCWNTVAVSSIPMTTASILDISTSTEQNHLLTSYDTHQEAVIDLCWTRKGSWHFFSLSSDGRLAVSAIPPTIKYRILL